MQKTIQNFLFGTAVADSFGTGIEGQCRKWIRTHVDFTRYLNCRTERFLIGYSVGDYSDDTADVIAMMHALTRHRQGETLTTDILLSEIRAQYEISRLTRNGNPRSGYGSIQWVFENRMSIDELRRFQAARTYPGNAPVMRAAIIGFMPESEINILATINADATHPHPKARAASILVARALRFLVQELGDPLQLIDYCREHIRWLDPETYVYLGLIDALSDDVDLRFRLDTDFELIIGTQPIMSFMTDSNIYGLNSDSMRTAGMALYLLKHCRSSMEALRRSIRIGGDVDSLAAVVVGIIGARYGLSDIPDFMFREMEFSGKNIGMQEFARRI